MKQADWALVVLAVICVGTVAFVWWREVRGDE